LNHLEPIPGIVVIGFEAWTRAEIADEGDGKSEAEEVQPMTLTQDMKHHSFPKHKVQTSQVI
jgi:hypothetical protein